ncbi:MAG: FtsQ-type POTRA domain-containing protein [Eubacteriales bacterium]
MTYTPSTWYRILSLLLVVVVFVAGIAIFFRVEEIAVTGNALYTVEELQNASGVEEGDNLLILSKGDVAGSIMAVLPYVEEVRISKELPNRLTITIVESEASYMVSGDDGNWWLINSEGKLLEQADAIAGTYPTISDLVVIEPVAGMDMETENPDVADAAVAVMKQLESTDYLGKIVEINVEKPYEIIMYYEDIYQIELGGYDQMSYKIQYLTAVLEQLRETETGIIDLTLSEENVARFRPW